MKKLFSILTATLLTVSQLGGLTNFVRAEDGVDVKIDISERTVSGLPSCAVFTDKEIEPEITKVNKGSDVLSQETDFDVSYEDNINAGIATVKITGKGNYKGEIIKTFKIIDNFEDASTNLVITTVPSVFSTTILPYNGEKITPVVTSVKLCNTALTEGEDYEVSYGENDSTGEGKIIATGKGLLQGVKEKAFQIGDPNSGQWVVTEDGALKEKMSTNIKKNIVLLKDVTTTTNRISFASTAPVLNLNNHNLTIPGEQEFAIFQGSSAASKSTVFTIKGQGTIEDSGNGIAAIAMINGETLNVEKDVVINGEGILVQTKQGGNINFSGTMNSKNSFGLYINGNLTGTKTPTIFNIADTAVVKSENAPAIYGAGFATWNIADGADIEGKHSAIELRAGTLNIEGGVFKSTSDSFSEEANGNGSTINGAAIAISQHTTNLPISVVIDGGTFEGKYALYEKDLQDNAATDKISIIINDGTFIGDIYSQNVKHFIRGGKFSKEINPEYLAEGYKISQGDDGYYTVVEKTKPTLTSDLASSAKVGDKVNFSFSTVANDYGNTVVIALSEFNNDAALESLYSVNGETKTDILNVSEEDKGKFGPFPLIDGTSNFEVTFKTAGTYTFTVRLVDNTNNEIEYAKLEKTITISNKSSGGSSSGGGGGGGGSSIKKEETKTEDKTTSTNKTETTVKPTESNANANTVTPSIEGSKYSDEQNKAYVWARQNGITTIDNIQDAALDQQLTRAQLAKMMSVYAVKVLGKEAMNKARVEYSDVDASLGDLKDYIQMAFNLQIMGINADGTPIEKFNPNGKVSRAEFATIFSRVMFGDKYNQEGADFYTQHLNALKEAGILSNTTPEMKEMRGWVMLMLMRTENVK